MLNTWPTAGVIAAIVISCWGAISRMAFNIENQIKAIPNEDVVFAAMHANVNEPACITTPTTPGAVLRKSLGIQFATDLICGLLAAFLYSLAAPALKNLTQCLLFTSLLAVFAIQVPYWNWYGFPPASIATGILDQGVAGLPAGLVFRKVD